MLVLGFVKMDFVRSEGWRSIENTQKPELCHWSSWRAVKGVTNVDDISTHSDLNRLTYVQRSCQHEWNCTQLMSPVGRFFFSRFFCEYRSWFPDWSFRNIWFELSWAVNLWYTFGMDRMFVFIVSFQLVSRSLWIGTREPICTNFEYMDSITDSVIKKGDKEISVVSVQITFTVTPASAVNSFPSLIHSRGAWISFRI